MLVVLEAWAASRPAALNFDAKVRRESFEPVDLFHAHIGGMDAFARGLKIAHAIIKDGRLDEFVKDRYSSFDSGVGNKIEPARPVSPNSKNTRSGLKSPHSRQAAARKCWRISSMTMSGETCGS